MRALAALLGALLLAACGSRAPQQVIASCPGAAAIGTHVAVPAGRLDRGRVVFRQEEQFGGRANVAAFDIDATEVTNGQFAAFVDATHYVTRAERREPDGQRYGAAVFDFSEGRWRILRDADWRHPHGRNTRAQDDMPVVNVAFEDAAAYARGAGRRLPSEAEWEFAARGGARAPRDIGAEARDATGPRANYWQGIFPMHDQGADGYVGTAPVGCFAANARGLYDMIGNVWEWTTDWYGETAAPRDEAEAAALDPERIAKRVIKGGSHLCADNFCARFRSGARQGGDPQLGQSHVGFRTVSVR